MSLLRFAEVAGRMSGREPAPHQLALRLEELTLRVRSNSESVIQDLRRYFSPFLTLDSGVADLDFLFLDGPVETPPVELFVRAQLPGKKPDKERFADLLAVGGGMGGRIVRKQGTGMLFVFGGGARGPSPAQNIAIGPCAVNRNQLVNFLCARYMERRVAAGWVLGHAAGVARPVAAGGKALALCGLAGLGKSTLALHLVARGLDFVSNDRVMVQPRSAEGLGAGVVLHGIPKHPRLNPGTALGNPELAPLLAGALPEAFRRAYADLPSEALRAVEDKFDAVIDECFSLAPASPNGEQRSRFRLAAPLAGLVVLNWSAEAGDFAARRVDLAQRPDLLKAFRKPPGVFYLEDALCGARLTASQCLETLSGVPVLELSGRSDFSAGASACLELLG